MEGHLSVATIEALNQILRTCRNMRHVIRPRAETWYAARNDAKVTRSAANTPPTLNERRVLTI
jgi:hypothetical protein